VNWRRVRPPAPRLACGARGGAAVVAALPPPQAHGFRRVCLHVPGRARLCVHAQPAAAVACVVARSPQPVPSAASTPPGLLCTPHRRIPAGRTPRSAPARRGLRRGTHILRVFTHLALGAATTATLTCACGAPPAAPSCSRCARSRQTHHTQARMSSQSIYVSLRCAARRRVRLLARGGHGSKRTGSKPLVHAHPRPAWPHTLSCTPRRSRTQHPEPRRPHGRRRGRRQRRGCVAAALGGKTDMTRPLPKNDNAHLLTPAPACAQL
jgi:hypothetical protein